MAKRKTKKATHSKRRERCMICKETFDRVTPSHLREHGFTVERYERMFGARCPPPASEAVPAGSVSDPQHPARESMIARVAERLTEDREWIACIADEVGESMLNGPLRQRLSALLTTMLFQRASVHGQALAVLSGTLEELQEEWRATQGGPDGGPTPTEELLRMTEKAAKVVKDSEEAVQRTIKLALEEQRAKHEWADALGPTLYTGTGEKLEMPAGMPAGDRETIRNLLALIGKSANEAGTVDAEAVVAGDGSSSMEGDQQVPGDETSIDKGTPQGEGGGGSPKGGGRKTKAAKKKAKTGIDKGKPAKKTMQAKPKAAKKKRKKSTISKSDPTDVRRSRKKGRAPRGRGRGVARGSDQ